MNASYKIFNDFVKFLYEVSRGEYRWYFLDSSRLGDDVFSVFDWSAFCLPFPIGIFVRSSFYYCPNVKLH